MLVFELICIYNAPAGDIPSLTPYWPRPHHYLPFKSLISSFNTTRKGLKMKDHKRPTTQNASTALPCTTWTSDWHVEWELGKGVHCRKCSRLHCRDQHGLKNIGFKWNRERETTARWQGKGQQKTWSQTSKLNWHVMWTEATCWSVSPPTYSQPTQRLAHLSPNANVVTLFIVSSFS